MYQGNLSEAVPTATRTVTELGLMMAGQAIQSVVDGNPAASRGSDSHAN